MFNLPKFGLEFDHVTADTLRTFKVKRSKVSSQRNVRYEQ